MDKLDNNSDKTKVMAKFNYHGGHSWLLPDVDGYASITVHSTYMIYILPDYYLKLKLQYLFLFGL
jgi:hypothetical protein